MIVVGTKANHAGNAAKLPVEAGKSDDREKPVQSSEELRKPVRGRRKA